MSSHLDLGPADLDRLEDALEDLELSEPLLDHGLGGLGLRADDPVAQRLAEFRQILRASRQALPLEEVPAGLLDGVLAEARQAAAAAAGAAVASKPSFWARWRLGVWVPTLAFAGSAALLLLVLVPKDDEADTTARVAQSDHTGPGAEQKAEQKPAPDDRLAFAELDRAEGARDGVMRGDGLAVGERAPDPAAAPPVAAQAPAGQAPVEEQAAADPVMPKGAAEPDRRKRAPTSGSGATGSAGALPSPPKPSASGGKGKTAPSKKDEPPRLSDEGGADLWPEITRADTDRRGGSCGLAKMRYDKLRKTDDARVRARALAGLGLCEAVAGSKGTAEKLFAQARAADPEVGGFIDRELAALEDTRANAYEPSPARK
jgi:hypothetical protein